MAQISWDGLKIMRAVASGGSVRAAAELLNLHHSTVIRRVEQLEKELGTLVFTRTPRGLELTLEGSMVLEHAERVQQEMDNLELRVQGSDQKFAGKVRITMPDILAVGFVMQDFAKFTSLYPDIELVFIPSHVNLNIAAREADIAIRVTTKPPEDLIGKLVGKFTLGVYVHEDYLKLHDPVKNPEACHWIGWGDSVGHNGLVKQQLFPNVPMRTSCDSVLLQLSAVKSGVGMALLPCGIADREPGLVRISDELNQADSEIWILTHPDLRFTARIKVLMDFLSDSFHRNAHMLRGVETTRIPAAAGSWLGI